MSPTAQRIFLRIGALAALLVLGSCGGGAEPESSSVPQTLSFAAIADQTFGAAPQPLSASASSGLPVNFSSDTPAVCSVRGSSVALVGAGECAVSASQPGDEIYAAASTVTNRFRIAPAPQTITFVSPGNQMLGTDPAALNATASSGLPVSFGSGTPAVCRIDDGALVLLAAGNCRIDANQPGNGNYLAAPTVSRSFSVAPLLAPQSISFDAPADQVLGTTPPALSATASSGLPVSFTSMTPAVCGVSGSTLTLLTTGTCTVAASQAGDDEFAAADSVMRSFSIAPAAQTISFNSPGDQELGTSPLLSATASSALAVTFESDTPAVCTVSGNTLALLTTGTCTITATQPGNAGFAAADPVSRSFAVVAAAQTISFAAPGNQTLGTTPPALVASASSGLPVTLASTTPGTCTVSGTTLTLVAAGTCSIQASQAGNASFAAATTVTRSFSIAPAPKTAQTISFISPGSQALGSTPPALQATASSGLTVSFASITQAICSVSGSTLTLISAGTCSVRASQAGDATYAAATPVTLSFLVSAAPLTAQTITFASPGTQTVGTPAALVASASSGLPVSFASTTPQVCTVSGTALTLLSVGTCSVTASQAGNATFAGAPSVQRSFSVVGTAQSISFAGPGDQILGNTPPALAATATSGLTVTFASTTPAVCTASGTTLTLVSVGTCSITASQAGNSVYAAAPPVARSFNVAAPAPLTQTISFASPGDQVLTTASLTLTASASSGLPVAFASNSTGVCTVSGNTLTLVAAGSCSVTASQGGNGTYAAAPDVTRVFTVSQATQTISFANPGTQISSETITLTATSDSNLAVSYVSTTPSVCSISGNELSFADAAGTCSVTASQSGNTVYAAAASVTRSFAVALNLFANGGFELSGAGSTPPTPALAWLAAASGYTRSTDARTGGFSAQLRSPAFNAAVMLQNSIEQGLRTPVTPGTSPTLRFWAKGTAGATGSVLFALRYLDGTGNILANSQNQFFQSAININGWTEITFNLGVVPANATAAFIEFSQSIGPIGTGPAGEDFFEGLVLIDDLSLAVLP